MSRENFILPYGRQTIEPDDIAAVAQALGGEYLTTGPLVEAYEARFAEATGAKHAVSCNSGTAALHLAVLALGLGDGHTAVVPSITFLATANAVRMSGAEVVFADVDAETGLMTEESFSAALVRAREKKVNAAIPVHLNGQVCDMPALTRVASSNGIDLIEDACHALGEAEIGATKNSRLACFSTHPVKGITTGEGGVVTTSDESLTNAMRLYRSHGMTRQVNQFENRGLAFSGGAVAPWYYEMHALGWNYRLPDILCALGISQLTKLQRFFARRREIAALYDELLGPLAPLLRPVPHGGRAHGWHLYAVLIDFAAAGLSRIRLVEQLARQGIRVQVHYIPLHLQPYYRRRYGAMSLPGAEQYYARCLSLPIHPRMANEDVHRVATVLLETLSHAGS